MSKKITIQLNNIKSFLHDLFHEYLDEEYERMRKVRSARGRYYDEMDDDEMLYYLHNGYVFDGMDEEWSHYYENDDDDEVDVIWPPKKKSKKGKKKDPFADFWNRESKKTKNKHRRGGKKRGKIIDINTPYSGEEENPLESVDDDEYTIYYYPNYREKYARLEFKTLKAFDDFCADNGFVVPPFVGEQIAYRRISHTCLRPDAREEGIFEIMAEESYGDMMYEAIPVAELSQ